jgi:hypothetical protein
MAPQTTNMIAPASIGAGSTIQFKDGTTGVVGALGVVAVPVAFVNDMESAGFVLSIGGLSTAANGLVADTNANIANALPLPALLNRVTTSGAANAGVKLPPSSVGARIRVTNANTANAIGVYPQVNEAIANLAANANFSLAANKTADFTCAVAGQWDAMQG